VRSFFIAEQLSVEQVVNVLAFWSLSESDAGKEQRSVNMFPLP